MYTAWLAINRNMAPWHLISFLHCLITNGPNILPPQCIKGGASASLCMRSTIFCSPGVPLSLWHFTHLNKRLLTAAALQLVIQYPELLSSFKVAPLPPSAHFMWHCCMIRFDTFSPFGKMIGCLFSLFANNLLSQPPIHIIPLLFKNGPNCLIVELLGIVTSLLWLMSSAENLFSWVNLINWAWFWGHWHVMVL